jgi:hypothetical protein
MEEATCKCSVQEHYLMLCTSYQELPATWVIVYIQINRASMNLSPATIYKYMKHTKNPPTKPEILIELWDVMINGYF